MLIEAMVSLKFLRGARWRRRVPGVWARIAALSLGLALPGSALAADVLVLAAASLTDALKEIQTKYEATARDRLVLSMGASSDLARQIKAGAPADVFFSADLAQMEGLEKEGSVRRADRVDV